MVRRGLEIWNWWRLADQQGLGRREKSAHPGQHAGNGIDPLLVAKGLYSYAEQVIFSHRNCWPQFCPGGRKSDGEGRAVAVTQDKKDNHNPN